MLTWLVVICAVFVVSLSQSDPCEDLIRGRNTTRIRQGTPATGYVAKSTFTYFFSNYTFYEINLEDLNVTGGNYSLSQDTNNKELCHILRNVTDSGGNTLTECENLLPLEKSNALKGMEGCLNEADKPTCLTTCYDGKDGLNQDLVAYFDNGGVKQDQVAKDILWLKR
eukprot:224780_1